MKVKRNFINGVLIIIATIMTTTNSIDKQGGRPSRFRRAKDSIISFFTMSPKSIVNWKTSSFARAFYKEIGFAPIVSENDVDKLLTLISTEADLIKIGAFRKLNKLSDSAVTEESKKKLILAKLQGTIELIKLYGIRYNCPKVKWTLAQGMYYAYKCEQLFGKQNQADCLRKKIQLYTAFMFSHKLETNRFVRYFINRTRKDSNIFLRGDKTIQFIDTRIACEIKFSQDKKNIFLRSAMKLYMGTSDKNKSYNCVNELLVFENHIEAVGSYPGEYNYLLARAYGLENNYPMALFYLRRARAANVFDSKTRETNKKVQAYYEKIFTRMDALSKK